MSRKQTAVEIRLDLRAARRAMKMELLTRLAALLERGVNSRRDRHDEHMLQVAVQRMELEEIQDAMRDLLREVKTLRDAVRDETRQHVATDPPSRL